MMLANLGRLIARVAISGSVSLIGLMSRADSDLLRLGGGNAL